MLKAPLWTLMILVTAQLGVQVPDRAAQWPAHAGEATPLADRFASAHLA